MLRSVTGSWLPTFRNNLLVPSSSVMQPAWPSFTPRRKPDITHEKSADARDWGDTWVGKNTYTHLLNLVTMMQNVGIFLKKRAEFSATGTFCRSLSGNQSRSRKHRLFCTYVYKYSQIRRKIFAKCRWFNTFVSQSVLTFKTLEKCRYCSLTISWFNYYKNPLKVLKLQTIKYISKLTRNLFTRLKPQKTMTSDSTNQGGSEDLRNHVFTSPCLSSLNLTHRVFLIFHSSVFVPASQYRPIINTAGSFRYSFPKALSEYIRTQWVAILECS
jgi:hypothetical protein